MADYKEMYYKLFHAVTNAITILQEAQKGTEEIYINSNPTVLELLKIAPMQEDSVENAAKISGSHAE